MSPLSICVFRNIWKQSKSNQSWKIPSSMLNKFQELNTSTQEIAIPRRIHRSPTDILEALASTVKRDPTGPEFKFHDDPYLMPLSINSKKTFALAQEAGRKAAKWIKQEHSDLFQHRNAEPFIEAFAPAAKLTETTPVSEELLKKYLTTVEIQNAVKVYEQLMSNKLDVSQETKQTLLELVSFYNEVDQMDGDLVEERWFTAANSQPVWEKPQNTWKKNGFAERLFNSMEVKTLEAYGALICGMAKHGEVQGAFDYYNQMNGEGLKPNLQIYNSIFKPAASLRDDSDSKWEQIREIMSHMVSNGVRPNVSTLNAVLEVTSTFPILKTARQISLKVLAEFKAVGVSPSLASYYFILDAFYRKKGGPGVGLSKILVEIVDEIEKDFPPLQDVKDVMFFARAMDVCHNHLGNLDLAQRIHQIVSHPSHKIFFGDAFRETLYYRNFLKLVFRSETPEKAMELYNLLVPHIYSPEQNVFEELLLMLREYSAAHYVPQLWTDGLYLDLVERGGTLEILVDALASGTKSVTRPIQDDQQILKTAKDIWTHIENTVESASQNQRAPFINFTGPIIGSLMKIYLAFGEYQTAFSAMKKAHSLKEASSFIDVNTLNQFIDTCIKEDNAPLGLMAVEYASDAGYPQISVMAKRISEELVLDESQQQKLDTITGKRTFMRS